ncbi:MAG: hypothetical protein ACLFU4_09960 [Opitutales bacterium]
MLTDELRTNLLWATGQKKLPEGHSLPEVLAWLDRFAAGRELPERLAHYLSRRSYVKALEWLDDPDTPHRV